MRIILFLAAFFMAAPAQAAVELAFYSYELQADGADLMFPHAFFTMKGRLDAGGRAIDASYGFTAITITPAILWGPTKGAMMSADAEYIKKSRRHFVAQLSDAQYASVYRAYQSWAAVGGKSYSLNKRNCVHFVAEIARAAGLRVPNDKNLMKKPRSYLEALARMNGAAARSPANAKVRSGG